MTPRAIGAGGIEPKRSTLGVAISTLSVPNIGNSQCGVAIKRLRGILKRKPGDKPLAQEWAEHKATEIALEEAKYARSTGSR